VLTDGEHRTEHGGNIVVEGADEMGQGCEVRLAVAPQGDEGRVAGVSAGDASAAEQALRIAEQHDLEQHRGRISGGTSLVVAIAGVEVREVELMIDEIAERMLEGSGTQLLGQIQGDEAQIRLGVVVPRHRRGSCAASSCIHTDRPRADKFLAFAPPQTLFLHPR